MSRFQTEYLECKAVSSTKLEVGTREAQENTLNGKIVQQSDLYCYLGSITQQYREFNRHVTHRIRVGWLN